jgi:HEAT repeat protein
MARLRAWVDGPEGALHLAAAAVLAGAGGPEDAELITRLLRDPSARVRRVAVDAVAHLGPVAALGPLRLALVDDAPRVRMAAVTALAGVESGFAVEDLGRLADDPDAWVRAAAVRSLGTRSVASADAFCRERALEVLDRALQDEVLVALGAVEALLAIGGEEARRVTVLLDRPEPELVKEAIGCVEAHFPDAELDVLLPLIEHAEWAVRAEATRVLGARGVQRAVPAILERLHAEQDEFVRETVLQTLERLDA